jgi:hypothetical protein
MEDAVSEAISVGALSRDDMIGVADAYLEALGARDPSGLHLADGFKFTENGLDLPLGTALWATATGSGSYRFFFADTREQQVGAYAVVEEMGQPAILALRLRLRGGRISEIEHIVGRGGSQIWQPQNLKEADPIFEEQVEPPRRASREVLIRAADSYYEAIEQGDGNIVPVIDECVRRENGALTALTPEPTNWGSNLSVAASIHLGCWTHVRVVRRRYPLVDEERGLAWAINMFENPGNVAALNLRGIGPTPLPVGRLQPSALPVAELFKVIDGKIHRIETVLGPRVPYGMPSGWE